MPPTPTLESIETVSTGWINKYHLHYTLPDGRPYTYEGVSRKGPERYEAALEALGSTGAPDPDAVCIVPLLPDGSVLLEREFRYPCLLYTSARESPAMSRLRARKVWGWGGKSHSCSETTAPPAATMRWKSPAFSAGYSWLQPPPRLALIHI